MAIIHGHIDHIVPCAYFDLSNPIHQRRCFNYRNMQPLPAKENISKRDNLTDDSLKLLPILEQLFPDKKEILYFDDIDISEEQLDGENELEDYISAQFELLRKELTQS